MLRTFGLLLTATVLFFALSKNASADEYGERFYNHTPSGMAEYTVPSYETPDIAMDDTAEDLQNIMPAAGDAVEDVSEQDKIDAVKENADIVAE